MYLNKRALFVIISLAAIGLIINHFVEPSKNILRTSRHRQATINPLLGEYEIVNIISRIGKPIFTQGLAFLDNTTLIESGGLYRESSLSLYEYPSLKLKKRYFLDQMYFAEGAAFVTNKTGDIEIHQLTYKERVALVYDRNLRLYKKIALPKMVKEGWGLAKFTNAQGQEKLIISDGTPFIYIVDPSNYNIERSFIPQSIEKQDLAPSFYYNELEVVDNKLLLANIWTYDVIVAIDISSGIIVKIFDMKVLKQYVALKNLYPNVDVVMDPDNCLNGIAYNKAKGTFVLTGKRWSYMFEVILKDIV